MKVTKRQLKKIIKEELEAALSEQGSGPDPAKAEEMAQVLSQSPDIMAAIKQAIQDPKVQAALEQATSGDMQEGMGEIDHLDFENDPVGQRYKSAAQSASNMETAGYGVAALGMIAQLTPGAIAMIAGPLAVTSAMAGVGILGGFALSGVAVIAAQLFSSAEEDYVDKATNIHKRNPVKDFGQQDYEKTMSKGK